jgi:hypothetical protein
MDIENEIELAQQQIAADPTFRKQIVFRIGLGSYLRVLNQCQQTGKPLSQQLDSLVAEYWQLKDSAGVTGLNLQEQETVKALATLCGITPMEAIKEIIRRAGMEVLAEKMNDAERLSEITQNSRPKIVTVR